MPEGVYGPVRSLHWSRLLAGPVEEGAHAEAGILAGLGGGVTLYVKDQLECMELCLGLDEEPMESLWVKIKGRAGTGDITVGVCYQSPDQHERADEALYRQIGAASH